MFDCLSPLAHRLWICIEALLHSFEQMLVLPPCNPPLRSQRASNASITRTGLLSSMKSSRHSGKSIHCPRSASSTKHLINSPAESQENHNSRTAFSHSQNRKNSM